MAWGVNPLHARHDPLARYKVHEVRALRRPRGGDPSPVPRELLERAARQVQPLMRRRRWEVPLLVEFVPKSDRLLGLNVGGGGGRTQQIKVRCRKPGAAAGFYPYEFVLGTLLHELVHCVRGPHDAEFYRLLDEITAECERDMAAGVAGTGAGFDGPSAGRLGGRGPAPVHNPDPRRMREAVLQAAQKRWDQQAVMSRGGQRLGGAALAAQGLNPAQAAARAAERRLRDNAWCPAEAHIDLTEETEEEGSSAGAAAAGPGPAGVIELSDSSDGETAGPPPRKKPRPAAGPGAAGGGGGGWECGACTFVNPPARIPRSHCECCETWRYSRPHDRDPAGASTRQWTT